MKIKNFNLFKKWYNINNEGYMKEEIKLYLVSKKDSNYEEFSKKLCPNVDNILGVRVPVIKKYANELLKKYDIFYLILNIDEEYHEEKMLKALVIGGSKKEFKYLKRYIEDMVSKLDNWAICDTFCSSLKITNKYKEEMWKVVRKYLQSEFEYEVRFSLVMIKCYFIKEDYLEEIFRIIKKVKLEKYYIKMAMAWLISELLIKFYDETINYLKKLDIDKFTYNKAIQKALESFRISNEKKECLKKIKLM